MSLGLASTNSSGSSSPSSSKSDLYGAVSGSTGDKLDVFGGMNAGDRSRKMLLADLARPNGMADSAKSQAVDAANTQGAANIAAQAKNLGEAGLAGGPMAAVTGRAAGVQQAAAGEIAGAGALASAEVEKTSQAMALQEGQAEQGRLEREQDRARQDTQFWVNTLANPETLGAIADVVMKVAGGFA